MEIAAQLYTFLQLEYSDLPGICRKLKASGFDAVEICNHIGRDEPETVRDTVAAAGLRINSAHAGYDTLTADRIEDTMAYYRRMGLKTLVLPYGKMDIFGEDYAFMLAELRRIDTTLRQNGFEFLYHNHAFELTSRDPAGRSQYDIILEDTDIPLEADVYWFAKLGMDIMAFLEKWRHRIRLLHIKDMAADGRFTYTPIGQGSINWQPVVQFAVRNALSPMIIELEEVTGDPAVWLDESIRFLRGA